MPDGGLRWKNYDSDGSPKYRWCPTKPTAATYYHGPDLPAAIRQALGVVWLVNGEADVWALHAAGLPNVLSCYSETALPPTLSADLRQLGVKVVYIAPDRDDTGQRFAQTITERLQDSPIRLIHHELPATLGPHGDLGKAWAQMQDRQQFLDWLLSLPEHAPPPPTGPARQTTPPTTHTDLPQPFYEAIEAALGVTGYYQNGFSRLVACPFHDDQSPSAGWHREKHFLNCFTCGQEYKAIEVGAALGLDWHQHTEGLSQSPPEARTEPLQGLPTEARQELLQRGLTGLTRLLDILYQKATIQPGTTFTMKDILDDCREAGLAYQTVYTALQSTLSHGPERNIISIFAPFSLISLVGRKKEDKNRGPGRPARQYGLPTPSTICTWLGLDPRKVHYAPMPEEALGSARQYRAEVYAALPRSRPGRYTRQTLADKVGVTPQTARTYDRQAGLKVRAHYERRPLPEEALKGYTEFRGDRPGNEWIEDERGRRYTPTKEGFARALAVGRTVYQVIQGANYYSAGLPLEEILRLDKRAVPARPQQLALPLR